MEESLDILWKASNILSSAGDLFNKNHTAFIQLIELAEPVVQDLISSHQREEEAIRICEYLMQVIAQVSLSNLTQSYLLEDNLKVMLDALQVGNKTNVILACQRIIWVGNGAITDATTQLDRVEKKTWELKHAQLMAPMTEDHSGRKKDHMEQFAQIGLGGAAVGTVASALMFPPSLVVTAPLLLSGMGLFGAWDTSMPAKNPVQDAYRMISGNYDRLGEVIQKHIDCWKRVIDSTKMLSSTVEFAFQFSPCNIPNPSQFMQYAKIYQTTLEEYLVYLQTCNLLYENLQLVFRSEEIYLDRVRDVKEKLKKEETKAKESLKWGSKIKKKFAKFHMFKETKSQQTTIEQGSGKNDS